MARFTDAIRKTAGVRDLDPVAPVFDAIDDLNARVVIAETDYEEAKDLQAKIRRETLKGAAWLGLVAAATSTGLAIAAATYLAKDLDRRSSGQVRALDEERSSSFNAKVASKAAEVAFTIVTQANGRAAAAEAQLEVARDKLVAMARNADDDLRAVFKLSATASRDDIALLVRLLRHADPNVRKACDSLTTMTPATTAQLLEHFTANKGRL